MPAFLDAYDDGVFNPVTKRQPVVPAGYLWRCAAATGLLVLGGVACWSSFAAFLFALSMIVQFPQWLRARLRWTDTALGICANGVSGFGALLAGLAMAT